MARIQKKNCLNREPALRLVAPLRLNLQIEMCWLSLFRPRTFFTQRLAVVQNNAVL